MAPNPLMFYGIPSSINLRNLNRFNISPQFINEALKTGTNMQMLYRNYNEGKLMCQSKPLQRRVSQMYAFIGREGLDD